MSAVRSLYCWYRQYGASDASTASAGRWPPLVINTHGWIKGIGLDVLAEVLAAVNPTYVLQVWNMYCGGGVAPIGVLCLMCLKCLTFSL